jgi:hypothetical protein
MFWKETDVYFLSDGSFIYGEVSKKYKVIINH